MLKGIIATEYPPARVAAIKESHEDSIRLFTKHFEAYKPTRTCLMCIMRPPEHTLPCKHTICEVCIKRYGKLDTDGFRLIESCYFCGTPTNGAKFRFRPDTKSLKVLGIDGGGVKAVAPLRLLELIEKITEPLLKNYHVQNHFDVAYGTSSGNMAYGIYAWSHCANDRLGGLAVLAMFQKGLGPKDCIQIFQRLAQKAFRGRYPHACFLVKVVSYLHSIWAGSIYPSEDIQNALEEQFGRESTLHDYSPATARGAKVGVTMTGVLGGNFIATNFNRSIPDGILHCQLALPSKTAGEIKVCDA